MDTNVRLYSIGELRSIDGLRVVYALNKDGSATAFAYDALGNSAGTVKIGAGQALSFAPLDFTLADVIALDTYVTEETPAWKENSDLGLSANGVPSAWWDCNAVVSHVPGRGAVTASVTRVQLTGLSAACVSRTVSTDADGVTTVATESADSAGTKTTVRQNLATGTAETSVSLAGYELAETNALGSATTYGFDGFARRVSATQVAGDRTLRTATGYRGDGSVAFTAEFCGAATNVTSYSARQYLESPAGAYTVTATDALGNPTVSYCSGDGAVYRTEGATYPTATARDADGHQSALCTWRDENGQPDVTRWNYDTAGVVTNKVYANGIGPSYAYLPDGQLSSRIWARGVATSYGYADTAAGSVQGVAFSDATHAVTSRYDLVGQLVAVDDALGHRMLAYNTQGRVFVETNSLVVITWHYDAVGRDAGYDLEILVDSAGAFSVRYGYDGGGRLGIVASTLNGATNTFQYAFLPGTTLVSGMTNGAGFGWSRTYEPNRNLIAAVSNFWGDALLASFDYSNDVIGRRTLRIDASASLCVTNLFAYNSRSEVANAAMGESTYSYSYDSIGNRVWLVENTVTNTYTANCLNQYSAITGGISASPTYDADGNLRTYGAFTLMWDAENRLITSTPDGTVTNGSRTVENAYDYQNRRVQKVVKQLFGRGAEYPLDPSQAGTWVVVETHRFVWDGWNIAAEITVDESAGTTNVTHYVWGADLSGSLQGAGGVGGLLAVFEGDGSVCFPAYDANGNITDYVDANGTVVAHREYDPFGNTTVANGPQVHSLHFWFSTKYLDEETGLYYYGNRFLMPKFGRWLSRDVMDESYGLNLYNFNKNQAINRFDVIGLSDTCPCELWEKIDAFRLTVYNVANEKDYLPLRKGDHLYKPNGLSREYSWNFMKDVDMQGTGIDANKRIIKLISTRSELTQAVFKYAYVNKITGKSGRELVFFKSVAVDPSVIPLGSSVCIDGYGEKSADDTGGAINGNHIDMFVNWTREDALGFGARDGVPVFRRKVK